MKQKVFGPDVNFSYTKFTVDKKGYIRFGLAAIKNVGVGAVENIIAEREKNGVYKSIYDFVERVDSKAVNKKTMESLAEAGGFDCFTEIEYRSQYFEHNKQTGETFIETLIKYASSFKDDKYSSQQTLFDMSSNEIAIAKPAIPEKDPWSTLEKLNREKELVGIYLSAHPLDEYKMEIDNFCNYTLADLNDLQALGNKEVAVGGIITKVRSGITKKGRPFGGFTLEDYSGQYEFLLFGKKYIEYKNYFIEGLSLFVIGIVSQGWGREADRPLRYNIEKIEMLKDVKEIFLKKMSISMDIESINEDIIKELEDFIKENAGKTNLNFIISDKEKNISVTMLSRNYRIDVTQDVLEFFGDHLNFKYRLN